MFSSLIDVASNATKRVGSFLLEAFRPGLVTGFVRDAFRTRKQLLAENTLLRQQLVVAKRGVKRPKLNRFDRIAMVLLSSVTKHWRDAVLLVQPETVLRWHRSGFRLLWRAKSKTKRREPRIAVTTVELIRQMAIDNRLWGAERIRGELLKVGIRVSKRTVQRYMRRARRPRPWGQSWTTFLRNHLHHAWACDFLQTYDIWFRPIFAFFIIDVGSRKVVHVGVTREPSATWVAQQLRNATPFGEGPRFLIRDNDDKFGMDFDQAAHGVGSRVLRTAVRAPRMNAYCERFLGSVRRECLDHVIILSEPHLLETLREYVRYFEQRPHQGIGQLVPAGSSTAAAGTGEVTALPVLGGLHHAYRRAA